MINRYKAFCLVCLLATTVTLTGACASLDRYESISAIEVMKMIPGTYQGYYYINATRLRSDNDLKPLYEVMIVVLNFGILGINSNKINWATLAFGSGVAEYMLCGGDFDMNQVRKSLQEAGAEKIKDTDIETWTRQDEIRGTKRLYALSRGCIFQGTDTEYREYINVVTGKAESLHENKYLRDIAGRSPKMFYLVAGIPGGGFAQDLLKSFFPRVSVDALTFGFEKVNAQTVRHKYIVKFTDVATATQSMSDFTTWVLEQTSTKLEQVQAVQKEQYIEVTVTFPLNELIPTATVTTVP
jgi:hypothetical protein